MYEKILVVEDDSQIRNFIVFILEEEGFKVVSADTAQKAMSILVTDDIDILLLDMGLPDYDGMEVIKKLRQWSSIPIIVVSARDQDKEKADALDNGADDYLTKPFSKTELLARIRVAVRHLAQFARTNEEPVLSVGDLSIDLEKHLVLLEGKPIHVTNMEYNLLSLLFKNIGKVLTSQYIIKEIYGIAYGSDTQALEHLLHQLGEKLKKLQPNQDI